MDDATLQSKTNALRQRHNINNARYRERNAIRIAEEANDDTVSEPSAEWLG